MIDKIHIAEQELEDVKRAYLKKFGWKETCCTPGSYWLWVRDFSDIDAQRNKWSDDHKRPHEEQYGVLKVPTDLAVSMTRRVLDDDDEQQAEREP